MIEATSTVTEVVHRHTIEGFGLGFAIGIFCGMFLLSASVLLLNIS